MVFSKTSNERDFGAHAVAFAYQKIELNQAFEYTVLYKVIDPIANNECQTLDMDVNTKIYVAAKQIESKN